MRGVFVSYKREDEQRVHRLVRGLEGAGFTVWWDRNLAAGENWRGQIQEGLTAAQCVVAVWTHASVGPAGDFVRDEAAQAKIRGILVPVRLDPVPPPLGFGEVQAIDLTAWKGSPRDPFFEDLMAAVRAKMEAQPAPPAKGPTKRLMQRLRYGTAATALLWCSSALIQNWLHVQDRVCAGPILQPLISDACGSMGLGNRPTGLERAAWEARAPGDCAGLSAHIQRFPNGAYRNLASALMADRRVAETEVWIPTTRRLRLFVPAADSPSTNRAAAEQLALERGQTKAVQLCKGFPSAKLKSARPDAQEWVCHLVAGGIACGLEGEALCELEEREMRQQVTCGK